MKRMMMLFAAGTVIGALAMRPKCETAAVTTTAAAPPRVAAMRVPEPMRIATFGMPAVASTGRDVFAFRSVEDRRSRLSPPPSEGQARVPVLHEDAAPAVVVKRPDPPPAYNYLGAFGPQDNPILVYKGNGDVVNVTLRKP